MDGNVFRQFYDAGYHRLCSIVPPGAPISEKSTLARRPNAVGKAPGIKRSDGTWQGYDWLKHVATKTELDLWHMSGAGVGIRTGNGLVALDIDTLDETLAERAQQLSLEHLGIAPIRIGRWPKRLLLFRVLEETPYRRVKFQGGLVELLSDDRQFVAHGIHPQTGRPYEWQPHCWPYDSLTEVSAEQVARYFAAVASEFPAAEVTTSNLPAANAAVDQRQLLGEPDAVARAVAALPNTSDLFPTYDDYVRVGYAIKGATQDDSGLELFQAWAAKWDGGNEPEVVEADWHRMKPPFTIGAQYLYSLAQQHGSFQTGDAWFQPGSAQASPFDAVAGASETPTIEPIRWADLDGWDGEEPPPQEWEVAGFIPREEVTLLYGEGGIGKTMAMHQYAVAAAAGVPWLGQQTRQARVMCVFCEDGEKVLWRRHKAITRALGVSRGDIGDRLRIVSRTGEDNLLAAFNRNSGSLTRTAFWKQLHDDAVAWKADVLVVDTIADTFGGSEIDRGQVNAYVKTVLGGLARAIGGSVVALGHPSVAGRGEGRSGSTAWSNASRSRIYLRYPKGTDKGNIRELEGMKANYGPAGALLRLKWNRGAFDLLAASNPIELNALKISAESEVASVAEFGGVMSLEDQERAAVLAALRAARAAGLALNLASRSSAYAPKVLRREFPDVLEAARQSEIDGIIGALLRDGRVQVATWRDPNLRKAVTGFDVVSADNVSAAGVFN